MHFIVNDRPDIALLAGAGGVHVGQDDLGVEEARAIVRPRALGRRFHAHSGAGRRRRPHLRRLHRLWPDFRHRDQGTARPVVASQLLAAGARADAQAAGGHRRHHAGTRRRNLPRRRRFAGRGARSDLGRRSAARAPGISRRSRSAHRKRSVAADRLEGLTLPMPDVQALLATIPARRRRRRRIRPRPGPVRFHHDRRRLDDRLGHLHRLRRHRAPDRLGRRPAAGLDHHRPADGRRRALLRRTGGDDAAAPAGNTFTCANRIRRSGVFSTAGRFSSSFRRAPSRRSRWLSRDFSACWRRRFRRPPGSFRRFASPKNMRSAFRGSNWSRSC